MVSVIELYDVHRLYLYSLVMNVNSDVKPGGIKDGFASV